MHDSGLTEDLERMTEMWDDSHALIHEVTPIKLATMYISTVAYSKQLQDRVDELDKSETKLVNEVMDLEERIQDFKESIWYKIYKFFNK